MNTPIECGELPMGACAQMGAIAFGVPLFLLGGALELALYLWWGELSLVPLALALSLSVVSGVVLGLWVRARFQAARAAPSWLWVLALAPLLWAVGGFSWLVVLRGGFWALSIWLGVRWLPKAIFQIGSMC